MPYATVVDMVIRYGEEQMLQLSDRMGDGVLDVAVIDRAIADAGALIDGHLAGRYPVPLSPAPAILVGYACDLARYQLYPDADLAETHPVRMRYRDAIRYLEAVGAGKLGLGGAPEPTSDNQVQFTAGQKVFRREAV